NEWKESTIGMMLRTEIAQCDVRFTLDPVVKRERNVRLANARLPGKHHHSAFPLRDLSPPGQQQLDLLFTTKQRRQLGLVHPLEAAHHATVRTLIGEPAEQCGRIDMIRNRSPTCPLYQLS